VGLWTVGSETLVLATNMNYAEVTVSLVDLSVSVNGSGTAGITQVFDSGANMSSDGKGFTFESVGSGAFVVTT